MAIERQAIQDFLQHPPGTLLLDVRSPGEYHHAHIPGAVSFPLFTDEERKIVGTAYKQESREKAIKLGLDFFGPKMRKMVEEVEAMLTRSADGSRVLYIYCWRGGMRSGAVAWLMDLYGFKVRTLAGGYKAFRNQVLQSFEKPYPFRVLGGYTGSGKTEILQEMDKNGERVIDLEALANHRGSAFGNYGMPKPPSQEMFENLLATRLRLLGDQEPIWLEDESQRIGDVNIPGPLWQTLRQSPLFFLEIEFEQRLAHLVEEYGNCPLKKLIESTQRIAKRLGPVEARNAIGFLQEHRLSEAFRILLRYYDKRYLKGLHNREGLPALLTKLTCESVSPQNALLLTKHQPV